ncbi:B-cell receptor CD22-like [Embiotoca jacksoni]|uniref:B-cell receptor CD22-like n=1 Tax=Embiotoca jacksoni TaxID=100190 RepID=UPI0037049FA1
MATSLTFLLICCLLQGVLCDEFRVTLPQTIEVISGSCVTIPCSFNIEKHHERNLNNHCEAKWKSEYWSDFPSNFENLATTKEVTGDLTKKDCTTTFTNMRPDYSKRYYLKLVCPNDLKWDFKETIVTILVKDNPPSPTLQPSELTVMEGTSVSLTCSAPAPCWRHPPTLTWTSNLGHSEETLQEEQDKTKVKISVLNFTASHLHHEKNIFCTAAYKKQDGSTDALVNTSLKASISYSPKDTTVSVSPSGPVPENTNVALTCSSNANPAVRNYTWYTADRHQETYIGNGHVLNIEASKVNSPFFCKAENDVGVGRSNLSQIDVQYSPIDTTVSVSPSGPVPENTNVSLTCSSSANPAVRSYTWYTADRHQETYIGNGHVLNIEASKVNSPFFCKVENDVGVGRSILSYIDILGFEQHFGHCKGVLIPWAIAGFSLSVNVMLIIYTAFLCKARGNVRPKEEDRTYMSLDRRNVTASSEYDVIAQTPK